MRLLDLGLFVTLAATVASISPAARAASVAPAGKIRVHLDTQVLGWTRGWPGVGFAGPSFDVVGFGAGRPVPSDASSFGGGSIIALGVGYGLHRHLIVGARFGMNLTHSRTRSGDPAGDGFDDAFTGFTGTFTPYLEVLPIPEGPLLPYILVRTGFTGATQKRTLDDGLARNSSIAPLVGVGVGGHAFVTRYFSIDFGLTFDYRWFFTRNRIGSPDIPPPGSWHRGNHAFSLAATLGLSTWF